MNCFTTFVQLFVDGLAQGSIYAALALAIASVNQVTGLINFAQSGMAVLSAYIGLAVVNWLAPAFGPALIAFAIVIAIIVALAFSFVFGASIERLVMRRFERGNEDTATVATIGLLTLIGGVVGLVWTYNYQAFPSFFPIAQSFMDGGIGISVWSLTTFLAIVVIMGALQLLFTRTKLGLGLRAVADNPGSAALSGLKVGRLLMVGWGLAAVLGAVGGILIAPKLQLTPNMLDGALVYALAAVVVGGLDSPIGAVIAAWGIAIVENLSAAYLPFVGQDLKVAVPFVFLVIILIVRPQGLFGRRTVVRV